MLRIARLHIFIEFIISTRRFQHTLACAYEYVKLQRRDLPVDRLLFGTFRQFGVCILFIIIFGGKLSPKHINKLSDNGASEYPGDAFSEFTHRGTLFLNCSLKSESITSTGVTFIYLFFWGGVEAHVSCLLFQVLSCFIL